MSRLRNAPWLLFVAVLMALFTLSGPVSAGLLNRPLFQSSSSPQVVSYQGQVTVDGLAFTGTGYFKFAVVDSSGTSLYWSNDGTTSGEPATAVAMNVTHGLFNVLLGDTTLLHMTALPATAFNDPNRLLRVWFSSDGTIFTLLTPDRRISTVPYAFQSASTGALQGLPISITTPLDGQALVWSNGEGGGQSINYQNYPYKIY